MTNFFTLNPLNTKFISRISTIEKRIQKYGNSSSLISDEAKLLAELVKNFEIEPLEIKEDKIHNEIIEKKSKIRYGDVKEEAMLYSIPFTGDHTLFEYKPKKHPQYVLKGYIKDNKVFVEISLGGMITGNLAVQTKIGNDIVIAVNLLKEWIVEVNKEVEEFNNHLSGVTQIKITAKIDELKKIEEAIDNTNPFKKKPTEE
ncbi:hypothetical protein ACHRV1_06325 [Flavobacterium aquidurense]|uniref:hypothetical protein n=1 Tax=Flavobacterium aquidurense TaxID=362413 RepID=UPI003758352A